MKARSIKSNAAWVLVLTLTLGVFLGVLKSLDGRSHTQPDPAREHAGSATPVVSAPERPQRLTDQGWKNRVIPPDAELVEDAKRLPIEKRVQWGWDATLARPAGWVRPDHDPIVFPVFTT